MTSTDKSLYTQTADIEERCVEIIADLWHRPKEAPSQNGETKVPKGTSTIGSSEACMLAGMAMKVRWQEWVQEYQKSHPEFDLHKKPNLIISSGYQVCWEKFENSYLGGSVRTVGINFSKSAAHIIAQYYNFIRLGKEGYKEIHQETLRVATFIEVCWKLSDAVIGKVHWTLNDLSDRILMRGWQVPSYPLPANLEHVMIQRIVCRADLSMHMAEILVKDIADAVHTLNENRLPLRQMMP